MRPSLPAVCIASLLLAGCGADPAESARSAVEEASSLHKQSIEAGYPWRESKRRLAAAEAALSGRDYAGAQAEAEVAKALAQASLAQAAAEANASKTRFPFAQ